MGEIPDERILNTPFTIAGHRVDLMLPDELRRELDAEIPGMLERARKQTKDYYRQETDFGGRTDISLDEMNAREDRHMLMAVAEWAYGHVYHWEGGSNRESLSLKGNTSSDTPQGECTERTAFLYAATAYVQNKVADEPDHNLEDVDLGFYQTFDPKTGPHVCLAATTPEKTFTVDVSYVDSGVKLGAHFSKAKIGIPAYVASMLCNRGAELVRLGRMKEARDTYAAAREMAPNNAYVVYAPIIPFVNRADYHYSRAAALRDRGNEQVAETKKADREGRRADADSHDAEARRLFAESDEHLAKAKELAGRVERIMGSMSIEITKGMDGARYVGPHFQRAQRRMQRYQQA